MVRAKREYEGLLVAWHACAVIAYMPFTGKPLSPAAVNPYGKASDRSDKLAEMDKWVKRTMWRAWVRNQFREAGKEVPSEPVRI